MPTVTVRIEKLDDIHKVTISPSRLRIPNGDKGVVITWNAPGLNEFLPGDEGFQWKPMPGAPPPPRVTHKDAHTLEAAPYDNDFPVEVVWEYLIGVQKEGVKIQVDPEVDNDPPVGPKPY